MIDTFSFKIIHAWMKAVFTSARLNVMTHALQAREVPLPMDFVAQNAYTEMCGSSKSVANVMRNNMAYPLTLKKIPVARVVAANRVSESQAQPGTIGMLDEAQGIKKPKLTVLVARAGRLCLFTTN